MNKKTKKKKKYRSSNYIQVISNRLFKGLPSHPKKKNSIKKRIDPKITQKIWSSMISSYIDYERRNFKKK